MGLRTETAQDKQLRTWARNNLIQQCAVCGTEDSLEVDHIVPWSINPDLRYSRDNVQMLCLFHNRSKGNKMSERITWFDEEWLTKEVVAG